MGKAGAVAGSILFFFLAPGIVAFLIPWAISGAMSGWPVIPPGRGIGAAQVAGGALGLIGLAALIECFARFALKGLGTPAPVAPTKTLVVTGLYRHVRNPMYVAVVAIILAHALWFESWAIAVYGAFILIAFTTFVRVYEEPTLKRAHGAEYDVYCNNVGRWIPRLSPWKPTV